MAELMQAFDVFCLPSIYEGFPFVLVEAQADGLPCVVSNRVPEECNLSKHIKFLDLKQSDKEWAKTLIEMNGSVKNREKSANLLCEKGFDISENAKKLCQYYQDLYKSVLV